MVHLFSHELFLNMDDNYCDIFGWGRENSVRKDVEVFGCPSETQELHSTENHVYEHFQRCLNCIESHNLRVEGEKIGGIKELRCKTSTTEDKEKICAEYPVDIKIHVNNKFEETEMHLGDQQPKRELRLASQQSFTGDKTKIRSVSNAPPNLEFKTESKDVVVLTPESLNKCNVDIKQIGSSSDGGDIVATLREIFESWGGKTRRLTGAKPKVKSNIDLEKTSLFGAEDYEYEKYSAEDLSVERNVVNLYENPKPWVKRDYGATDFRSKISRTKRSNFKTGHSSNSIEAVDLLDPEENIKLAQKVAESVREAAFSCSLIVKVVEDGINIAQKYVKIATDRIKQEGSENSRYQSDAGEYRRVLLIASEKAKQAKKRARHADIAAKNTSKAAVAFSKVLDRKSGDVKSAHFLMNWAKAIAFKAKVDTYKAAFASLKAIRMCFREMGDSRNMVPSSNGYLNELARSMKRTKFLNIVVIFAFLLGCVIAGLYFFKPGNKANYYIYYSGFVLIICSVIVGFCGNRLRYNDKSVVLEEKRRRTIEKIDDLLLLMDKYFKMQNITHVHSQSDG